MLDVAIRAILQGFTEGQQQVAALNSELSRSEKAAKDNASGSQAAADALKGMSGQAAEAEEALGGVSRMALTVGSAVGVVLVTAAVHAYKELSTAVEHVRELGDHLNNLSARTGLSAQYLGSMQLAAQTNNLTLDSLTMGVQQFNKHIDETTRGVGESSGAFQRLDISLYDSAGRLKSTDELLLEVAQRFSTMENGAGKTTIAMQLFGRAGAELIPLLNEGAAGFAQLQEEARKAGIVLSDETAEAAKKLNENMAVLKAYGQGFWMEIASPIVEGLAKVTTAMREARREGDGFWGSLLEGARKAAQIAAGVGDDEQEMATINAQIARLTKDRAQLVKAGGNTYGIDAQLGPLQARQAQLFDLSQAGTSRGPLSAAPGDDAGDQQRTEKGISTALTQASAYYAKLHDLKQLNDADYLESLQALAGAARGHTELEVDLNLKVQKEKARQRDEYLKIYEQQTKSEEETQKDADKAVNDFYKKQGDEREALRKKEEEDINKHNLFVETQLNDTVSTFDKFGNRIQVTRKEWEAMNEESRKFSQIMGKSTFDSTNAFQTFGRAVQGVMGQILRGHVNVGEQVSVIWNSLWNSVLDEGARILTRAALEPLFKPLKEMLSDTWNYITEGFSSAWDYIVTNFGTAMAETEVEQEAFFAEGDFGWATYTAGAEGATAATYGLGAALATAVPFLAVIAGAFFAIQNIVENTKTALFAIVTGMTALITLPASIVSKLSELGQGILDFVSEVFGAIGDVIDAVLRPVVDIFNAIKDALKPLTDLIQSLLDAISSVTGGIFGGGDGGGIGGGIDTIFPGLGGIVDDIFGFAEGTDTIVSKPTLFMAGESGSERLTVSPLSGAAHNRLGGGGGSVTINGPVIADQYSYRSWLRGLAREMNKHR